MPTVDPLFSQKVIRWFNQFGRHDLPWQNTQDPYQIWISEIMLQQTQVKTVIPFYTRFMEKFPDISSLATAEQDEVLHYWTGLGYYARARNLHKAAQTVVREHNAIFPDTFEEIVALPGIGRSTAGAILSFAFSQRYAILDGNVKRVLSRHFGIAGWPGESAINKQLWQIAEACTPHENIAKYTQAIMDFGASLCTRSKPHCEICPLNHGCVAFETKKIDQYPGKKPKKVLPIKTTTMLVLKNQCEKILLIQRPPTGIWGGLWSFPQFELDSSDPTFASNVDDFVREQITIDTIGNTFTHTFSHFHLKITPVYASLTHTSLKNDNAHGVLDQASLWYDPKNPLQIGLAAPIKKLLEFV